MSKDGEKNIEDVEVGDYVLAKNPETGEQEYKKVSETFAHKEDVIVHVQIGSEDIQTTFNHPFYVVGKGFVRAGKLEAGDEILTSGGQKISIEKIEIEVLAEPVYVYNFTVEDFHTYFVSELGVWVHNTCLVSKGGSDTNPTFEVSRKQYPNHVKMLENAQQKGHSLTNLTRGSGTRAARKNRYEAQKTIRKQQGGPPKGYDYDEFSYASTKQGGAGSHVEPVSSTENQAVGRDLGLFYRKYNIKEDDLFNVEIID